MQKILKQSYQPLTFERFFAVYMMWYDDELVKKFHGEVFPSILNRELGEVQEGEFDLELTDLRSVRLKNIFQECQMKK